MGASAAHRRADWQCCIRGCGVGHDAEAVGKARPARRAALYHVGGGLAGFVARCDVAVWIVACSGSRALRVDSAEYCKESEDELSPPVEGPHRERILG
jgi:hypothetical protein